MGMLVALDVRRILQIVRAVPQPELCQGERPGQQAWSDDVVAVYAGRLAQRDQPAIGRPYRSVRGANHKCAVLTGQAHPVGCLESNDGCMTSWFSGAPAWTKFIRQGGF